MILHRPSQTDHSARNFTSSRCPMVFVFLVSPSNHGAQSANPSGWSRSYLYKKKKKKEREMFGNVKYKYQMGILSSLSMAFNLYSVISTNIQDHF